MTAATLLLNADFTPIRVIPWEDAIVRILDRKAYAVVDYEDRVVRSEHLVVPVPAVLTQVKQSPTRNKVRFSRQNLMARDSYQCQYCGRRPGKKPANLEELTIDHVVPRAQSRGGEVVLPWNGKRVSVTCWENAVTACYGCNARKADRTPLEAGMNLLSIPKKPSPWDAIFLTLRRTHIPAEWQAFIPEDSPWKSYWDGELDPD